MPLDADGNANTTVDPVITYSPSGAVDAVRLEADFSYQSLTATNGGSEKFYIDSLTISVTSNNPNARIYLPNGTSVLVNPAGVAGDYNGNGIVDGADYVQYRNGGALQNEVATIGSITPEDYTEWRSRFGNTSGSGSGLNCIGSARTRQHRAAGRRPCRPRHSPPRGLVRSANSNAQGFPKPWAFVLRSALAATRRPLIARARAPGCRA